MHAFNELGTIISQFPSKVDEPNYFVAYACALVAELAYYHVPKWEIDDEWKRAKRVPCFGHQRIYQIGIETNLHEIGVNNEPPFVQIYFTDIVVAVVLYTSKYTFIGFRGTAVAHDWLINFQVSKELHHWHAGFWREATRICEKINTDSTSSPRQTILCGHSLGGAVAAAASHLLTEHRIVATYIFGAPRIGDRAGIDHSLSKWNSPIFHIRRPGDKVPSIPPKKFGYANYLNEYNCYLNKMNEVIKPNLAEELSDWYSFASELARPHFMEAYRSDVGVYANAQYKDEALVAHQKITKKNIHLNPDV
jgi:Lipase (class 3)